MPSDRHGGDPAVEPPPASIRCYAELNDYLAPERRQVAFAWPVQNGPRLDDVIAELGIPAESIDLVLVNGVSVAFEYRLSSGDRVCIYPVFEAIDVTPVCRLPGRPLRDVRFVLDVHLGRLSRLLRMLGFDALCRQDATDNELVRTSMSERRILLTRDRALARRPELSRVAWVESNKPVGQIADVLARFDLYEEIRPFTRCMVCNGTVAPVDKNSIAHRLLPGTLRDHEAFFACKDCGNAYWKGSHYRSMQVLIERLVRAKNALDE